MQPHHVPPSPLWVAATPGYSSDSDSSSIAAGGSPEATPASAEAAAEAAEDARAVECLTATVMTLADGMASARQPAWRALPAERDDGVDDSAEEVAAAEAAVADAADALGCAIVALRAAVGARCVRLEARASDSEREARGASFDAARKIAAEQHRNAALRLENATLAAELEAAKQARGARCHRRVLSAHGANEARRRVEACPGARGGAAARLAGGGAPPASHVRLGAPVCSLQDGRRLLPKLHADAPVNLAASLTVRRRRACTARTLQATPCRPRRACAPSARRCVAANAQCRMQHSAPGC